MRKSKSKSKSSSNGGTLCMIRSKVTTDMVGLVRKGSRVIDVECPLYIQVNTDLRNGNQVIAMVEAIPQSVVDCKNMQIDVSDVIFCEPLNPKFIAYYGTVRNMYYDNPNRTPKILDDSTPLFSGIGGAHDELDLDPPEEEPSPKKTTKKKTQKSNVH